MDMETIEIEKMEVVLISYKDFHKAYSDALTEWLKDDRPDSAKSILNEGVPKLEEDNISPFIKWAFLLLTPALPSKYFIDTHNAMWAVSGDECIVWDA